MTFALSLLRVARAAAVPALVASLCTGCEPEVSEPMLDASPSNDAGVAPADATLSDANLDAQLFDAGSTGSDAALDAESPADAASEPDAAVALDAGHDAAADAAQVDASVLADSFSHSRSGSLCQGHTNGSLSACPSQQCYAEFNRVVATIHSGALECQYHDGCRPAPPNTPAQVEPGLSLPFESTQVYLFESPDLYLSLTFNRVLLTEYTLERLRASLISSMLSTKVLLADGPWHLAYAGDPVSHEIVSYQAGVLHVHIVARVVGISRVFKGIPNVCTIGHLPTICNDLHCSYLSELMGGSGGLPTIEADVHIPIAPLLP